MSEFPDKYYSTLGNVGGSTDVVTKSFGFISRYTRLVNLGAGNIYANPKGLGLCTTLDMLITTGNEPLVLKGIRLSEMTLFTTSTGSPVSFSLSAIGE